MQAIIPTRPVRSRPYAWGSICLTPDPPRVGEMATITFPLMNPGPDDVVVERIDVAVAEFGIGVCWEELESIGPYRLAADPEHIEQATLDWVPRAGGHRCVRAHIHVRGLPEPFMIGRNLHVLEAAANEDSWTVRFKLGNPEPVAAPIILRVGGNYLREVDASMRVRGWAVPSDRAVMLGPGEVVEAELVLHAQSEHALHVVRTVEATINGRFIDGIQVVMHRPALVSDDESVEAAMAHAEAAYAFAR